MEEKSLFMMNHPNCCEGFNRFSLYMKECLLLESHQENPNPNRHLPLSIVPLFVFRFQIQAPVEAFAIEATRINELGRRCVARIRVDLFHVLARTKGLVQERADQTGPGQKGSTSGTDQFAANDGTIAGTSQSET